MNMSHSSDQLINKVSRAVEKAIESIKYGEKDENSNLQVAFWAYITDLSLNYLQSSILKCGLPCDILNLKKDDWCQDVRERLLNAIVSGRLKWQSKDGHPLNSFCKYLKSICFAIVHDDQDLLIRKSKRETQRAFRQALKNNVFCLEEINAIIEIIENKFNETDQKILIGSFERLNLKTLSTILFDVPDRQQRAWNKKEALLWKLFKLIQQHISANNNHHLISSMNKIKNYILPDNIPHNIYFSDFINYKLPRHKQRGIKPK